MNPPPAAGTSGRAATESDLLRRAQLGDRAALDAILRAHVDSIHAVCRRLCRDPGDAEDATQEALIAVARGLRRFDGRSALSTWIHRVATNACLDELRRRKRRPVPADPDVAGRTIVSDERGPAETVLAADQGQVLADALDELPEEFRVAVVLRDVADLDYAAIAEITEVPVGTVRSRIARGRARLADSIGRGTESERETSEGVTT